MGHPKSPNDIGLNFIKAQECADDKFVWTYTSQTFPMVQVNWNKTYSMLFSRLLLHLVKIPMFGSLFCQVNICDNRKVAYRSSHCLSLYYVLVVFCKLNYWVASRENYLMESIIYGTFLYLHEQLNSLFCFCN